MGRYTRTQITRNTSGKRYYKRVVYPVIPRTNQDIYVFTTDEDRYDLLALQFYKSADLWWIISLANPQTTNASLVPGGGIQIRIPFPVRDIITEYNALNE